MNEVLFVVLLTVAPWPGKLFKFSELCSYYLIIIE